MLTLALVTCGNPAQTFEAMDDAIDVEVSARIQGNGIVSISVRNIGTVAVFYDPCSLGLQLRDETDWVLLTTQTCAAIYRPLELPPGETIRGEVQINEEIRQDRSNEYRAWVALLDEHSNPLPDQLQASQPFRIE